MGGNGAGSHFRNGTLDSYPGVRFQQVGDIDGVKVICASTQTNMAVPMESFTSSMYYVTHPLDPTRIEQIVFYDKNGNIKASIDMEYGLDGSISPFSQYTRKGKVHTQGTHMHYWTTRGNGESGRKSHSASNVFPISSYYKSFLKKAITFNSHHDPKE